MADTWVLIQHPETHGRQAVVEAAVDHLVARGWERLGDETFADQPTAAAFLTGLPDDAAPVAEPDPAQKPDRPKPTKTEPAAESASTKEH